MSIPCAPRFETLPAALHAVDRVISQSDLRHRLSTVLRDVQAGRTVVVARRGVPVAELRPFRVGTFAARAVVAAAGRRVPRNNAERFVRDVEAVVDSTPDN